MATYNADAFLDSLEKPSITIGGRTYVGRIISYQQFLPFTTRIESLKNSPSNDEFLHFAVDYLTLIFPKRLFQPWAVPQILKLPNIVEVMTHFLELQAVSATMSSKSNLMNGTLPPKEQ